MSSSYIYRRYPELAFKASKILIGFVFIIISGEFLWKQIVKTEQLPYQYTIGFITSDLTKKSDSISVRYLVGTSWYSLKNALPYEEVDKLLQSPQRLFVKFEKKDPQRASLLFTPLPNDKYYQAGEILDSVFTSRNEN
ncbi:MAG: hypothetical protein IT252_13825 [Chitinophagaceae bacterium]|nr:hypothetical protein [Chitinophagaceae bacterium]